MSSPESNDFSWFEVGHSERSSFQPSQTSDPNVSSEINFAQVWADGFGWSEPLEFEEANPPPSYKLHSALNVGLATFLGSPAAGGLLMGLNFWRQRRRILALFAFAGGLGLTFGLASMAMDAGRYVGIPRLAFAAAGIVIMVIAAKLLHSQGIAWHLARGGQMAPARSGLGAGLVFMLLALGGFFLRELKPQRYANPTLGRKIDFGSNLDIYYDDGATETQARKLHHCLKHAQYAGDNSRTSVRLTRKDDGFVVAFCVQSWVFTDSTAIRGYEDLAQQLAEDFAPGRPITVQLCDEFMRAQVTLPSVTGVSSAAWRSAFDAGLAAMKRNEFAEASKKFQEAVREAERFGPHDYRLAESLYNQAYSVHGQGANPEAAALYQRALTVAEKARWPDDHDIGPYLVGLADCWNILGKYADAEPLARRALALREKKPDREHAKLTHILNLLGDICLKLWKYGEAEELFDRAKKIGDQATDVEPSAKAWTCARLAFISKFRGKLKDSEDLYLRAVKLCEEAGDADKIDLAGYLHGLANLYLTQDRCAEAEAQLKRGLAILQKAYGPNSPELALSRLDLARLHCWQEKWDLAEPMIRQALADCEKGPESEQLRVAECLSLLAWLEGFRGRIAEAEELAHRAKSIHEKQFGPDHPILSEDLSLLAGILIEKGDFAEAKRLLKNALAMDEKAFGPEYPDNSTTYLDLGIVHQTLGENAEAEQCYQRALSKIEKSFGKENSSLVPVLANYSILLRDTGRVKQADEMEKRARAIRAKYFKDKPLDPLPRRSAIG